MLHRNKTKAKQKTKQKTSHTNTGKLRRNTEYNHSIYKYTPLVGSPASSIGRESNTASKVEKNQTPYKFSYPLHFR